MNPAGTIASKPIATNTGGLTRERIRSVAVSKHWLMVFTLLHVALLSPYVTNLITHHYAEGDFPIRPAHFMILMGLLNLLWLLPQKPDFTKITLLIILLAASRAFDGALLQRFVAAEEHGAMVMSLGASLFMSIVISATAGVLYKTSWRPAIWAATISIFIIAGSVIGEYFGYGKYTNVEGRPSGHLGDPNNACIVMLLMLGIVLSTSKHFWFNILMIAISAAGVFPTLSRSGMLVLVLIIGAYVVLNMRQYFVRFVVLGLAAIPVIAAVTGLLMAKASEGGKADDNAKGRIEAIFEGDLSEMASNDRNLDFHAALEGILKQPLTGYGAGAGSNLYQPHNQLLTAWIDLGLYGLVLFGGILFFIGMKSVLSGFKGIYVTIPVLAFVPFSQILLDNYAYCYAMAIAAVVASRHFISLGIFRPDRFKRAGGAKKRVARHA